MGGGMRCKIFGIKRKCRLLLLRSVLTMKPMSAIRGLLLKARIAML
jgi:hypothetical protein